MSKRAPNRRLVPGLLLLALIAAVWASLALETPLPVERNEKPPTIGQKNAAGDEERISPLPRFDPLDDEVPFGFGEVGLLPAVVEALGDSGCDIDDPFSTCQ